MLTGKLKQSVLVECGADAWALSTSSVYGSGMLMEVNLGLARRAKAEGEETIYGTQLPAFSWKATATAVILSILPTNISVAEKGKRTFSRSRSFVKRKRLSSKLAPVRGKLSRLPSASVYSGLEMLRSVNVCYFLLISIFNAQLRNLLL